MKVQLLALLSLLCLFSTSALAQDKDQALVINLDENSCVIDVVQPDSEPSNCANRADCKKKDGCVCIKKDKHISWVSSKPAVFSFSPKPGYDWPMQHCKFKRNQQKMICKIKKRATPGNYLYNIQVEGCPTIYDPKIVIFR